MRRAILIGLFAAGTFHSIATAQANLTTYVYRSGSFISNVLTENELFVGLPRGFLTIQRENDNFLSILFTVDVGNAFYSADGNPDLLVPATLVTADVDLQSASIFNLVGYEAFGLAWMLCNPPLALTVNVMHTFPSGCPVPFDAIPPPHGIDALQWHATWSTPGGGQFRTFDESDAFLISVSSVPEPATIVLLAAGLAVIGLVSVIARRSRATGTIAS